MNNQKQKPVFYLFKKNFISGESIMMSLPLNHSGVPAKRETMCLEFLVDAPLDYTRHYEAVSLYLDKKGHERELLNGQYQIQHDAVCDDATFSARANNFIRTINAGHEDGIITLSFNDLVDTLQGSNAPIFRFKTFRLSELADLKTTQPDLASAPRVLAYITSEEDITMADYNTVTEAISNALVKRASLDVSLIKSLGKNEVEVSLFYALNPQNNK